MEMHTRQKYKVAFFHGALPLGGGEKVSEQTAKYLDSLGISSIFFATSWDKANWDLPTDNSEVLLLPKSHLGSRERLDFIIDSINRYNIRLLFIVNNYKYYCSEIRRRTKCRCIYWLHSCPNRKEIDTFERKESSLRFYPKRLLRPLYRLLWDTYFTCYKQWNLSKEKKRFDATDGHIVLCPEYKRELIERLSLSSEEAKRVYPIINTIEVNKSVHLSKKKEIVFLGRLTYADKRPDRLLTIWSKIYQDLPEWRLRIYGNGKEQFRLEQQIKELGLERVSLDGFVSNPKAVYDSSAILCLTSTYEGVPMVIIEAQNNGLVPIAFDCTKGVRNVIGEDAGVLIPAFDLDAYAQALKELCLNDERRQKLQENCLRKREEYSQERNKEVWWDLLAEDFFV